jgi:DNA-binding MurR/RpiR family transcriptional regulator
MKHLFDFFLDMANGYSYFLLIHLRVLLMKNIESLPKRQKKAAKFILDNPTDVAFLTIRELAEKIKVDPATVIRTCKKLGYKGYTDLQKQYKKAHKSNMVPSYDTLLKLLSTDSAQEEIIKNSYRSDMEVLQKTAAQVSYQSIIEVVERIKKSRNLYIIGLEGARIIASFLGFELRTYLKNIHDITNGGGYLFDYIRNFEHDDVVLGISFGRCIRETVMALKSSYERDITTISITDSKFSPLYRYSHISLLTGNSPDSHLSCFTGALSIAIAIISCCSKFERKHAVEQVQNLKEQWEEAKIYYSE